MPRGPRRWRRSPASVLHCCARCSPARRRAGATPRCAPGAAATAPPVRGGAPRRPRPLPRRRSAGAPSSARRGAARRAPRRGGAPPGRRGDLATDLLGGDRRAASRRPGLPRSAGGGPRGPRRAVRHRTDAARRAGDGRADRNACVYALRRGGGRGTRPRARPRRRRGRLRSRRRHRRRRARRGRGRDREPGGRTCSARRADRGATARHRRGRDRRRLPAEQPTPVARRRRCGNDRLGGAAWRAARGVALPAAEPAARRGERPRRGRRIPPPRRFAAHRRSGHPPAGPGRCRPRLGPQPGLARLQRPARRRGARRARHQPTSSRSSA